MKTPASLAIAALLAVVAAAYYTNYYEDSFSSIDGTKWYLNGTLSAGSSGLTSTGTGSLISKVAVPGGTSDYQVFTALNLPTGGGTCYHYLRASTDALSGSSPSGSFYSVELRNPTWVGAACCPCSRRSATCPAASRST